jgi:hypothetical protein
MPNLLETALTRRETFRLGALSVAGYWFLPLLRPSQVRAAARVSPRGSARFCIFVMLDGGQSHVDAWDLKEHQWTPPDFDIRTITPEIRLPYALYPKLAARIDKVVLARSVNAWDAVHGRAQYYIQAGHPLNLALKKEIPPIGAVVGLEYASRRKPSDSLPPYVAMNVTQSQAGLLNSGFLPATYSPFHINTAVNLDAFFVRPEEKADFERRWELLRRFDDRLRTDDSLAAKAYRDYHAHYEGAVQMMSDARTERIFRLDPEEKKRYGSSLLGDACLLARNLIQADAGTHFLFLQQNGWDHHRAIYERANHYKLSWDLDSALAALLDDLSAARRPDGRTLLDETLLVCMGEFGRTPGPPNAMRGRDHYQHAFTVLFAGGGVKGGRPLGKTDQMGAKVIDAGWSARRPIYMEDIATTVYSVLGIDWTKKIETTPSGRAFYYVEPLAAQAPIANQEIAELFG